ncbi:Alpha/Beta hydrolase protein, partial [Truncatella angustata]
MTTTDCAAVHLFLARGNTEPYPGRQSVLVAEVCDRVADCDYEDIVFKDGADDVYSESIYEGATNGYNQVNAYNARCPDAKLVISGYSQGGHVVSDILAGGGGSFFGSTEPGETPAVSASSAAGKAIKAVTTFGNVRHTPDQPYNYGTGSANTSSNPRDEAQQAILLTYANVWRDYCQIGDPVCAHGDVRTDHTNYFDLFTYGAAEWIVSKLS